MPCVNALALVASFSYALSFVPVLCEAKPEQQGACVLGIFSLGTRGATNVPHLKRPSLRSGLPGPLHFGKNESHSRLLANTASHPDYWCRSTSFVVCIGHELDPVWAEKVAGKLY